MRALDAAPDAAPAADLSCVGDPAPTTAPDPTILSGSATAVDASGATPVESVALQVHLESDPMGNQLTSGVTDAAGLATLTVDTGGVPVDVFVRATPRDTYLVSETFFPDVVSANLPAPALLLTSGTLNLLGLAAGQTQQEENGFGALLVLDCAGSPIFNATVNSPTGTVVYAGDNGIPDPALSATGARGLAFVFNIVPGEGLTFNAEVDGTSLRSNSARAVATQIVSLAFAPSETAGLVRPFGPSNVDGKMSQRVRVGDAGRCQSVSLSLTFFGPWQMICYPFLSPKKSTKRRPLSSSTWLATRFSRASPTAMRSATTASST